MAKAKSRLDLLLVERGLAASRERARALIMAGHVRVNEVVHTKPGMSVPPEAAITVLSAPSYVSRGALKLEQALDSFGLSPSGLVALDVGASTGGFTDVLLRRGATRVYAVDVGYGQLAWSLRQDPRVVSMERTNVRFLERLPEMVDAVVIDASFISLRLTLPAARALARPNAWIVALVKPQFEAGRAQVGKGGVVRDVAVHREVLTNLARWASENGFGVRGLVPSPIRGPAGNREFLLWLSCAGTETLAPEVIDASLADESHQGGIEACSPD